MRPLLVLITLFYLPSGFGAATLNLNFQRTDLSSTAVDTWQQSKDRFVEQKVDQSKVKAFVDELMPDNQPTRAPSQERKH